MHACMQKALKGCHLSRTLRRCRARRKRTCGLWWPLQFNVQSSYIQVKKFLDNLRAIDGVVRFLILWIHLSTVNESEREQDTYMREREKIRSIKFDD